jgi:hypothetical protein
MALMTKWEEDHEFSMCLLRTLRVLFPHSPSWLERKYETVHEPHMFTNCKFQWKGFRGLVPDVVNLHKYCLTLLPPSSNQYVYIYVYIYISDAGVARGFRWHSKLLVSNFVYVFSGPFHERCIVMYCFLSFSDEETMPIGRHRAGSEVNSHQMCLWWYM